MNIQHHSTTESFFNNFFTLTLMGFNIAKRVCLYKQIKKSYAAMEGRKLPRTVMLNLFQYLASEILSQAQNDTKLMDFSFHVSVEFQKNYAFCAGIFYKDCC